MKEVAFYTLGCKVSQYETEAIASLFEKEGYEVVHFDEKADVYVINTCTVTGLSARKSRQMIRKAKSSNQDSIVAVIGCYAQTAPGEVESMPDVNLVMGTKERNKIVEYVREIEAGRKKLTVVGSIMNTRSFEELKIDEFKERTRAFIKIQDGCSQFCSYCIIPYARGPIRSRAEKDILDEVRKLSDSGFKEIVLTGIHIASYGKDIGNTSLLDLIGKVHEVCTIERIRLGSLEPTTITHEFIETAKKLKKLCPHYHISLQSGCDETLMRMNRKYSTGEFRNLVRLLRDNINDVALTTDVMVGFPGESDEEFEKTYKFLEEASFTKMHVFKYSPRKGTPACSFGDQVAAGKKEERSKRLIKLSMENTLKFNGEFIGKNLPVLFEQDVKLRDGFIEGLTPNYIRVLCEGNASSKGKILYVTLISAEDDYLLGKITGGNGMQ